MTLNQVSGFLDLTICSPHLKQVRPLPEAAILLLHITCDNLYLCKHDTIFYGTTMFQFILTTAATDI